VPCEVEDDPVLRLVLSEADSYPYAEERRVFYVALTRARKHAFILCDRNRPSRFVTELVMDNPDIPMMGDSPIIARCPECKNGLIIKKNLNGRKLASCSNHTCLCMPKICPECSNGILLPEPSTSQYRCSNKDCNYTARICPLCRDGYLIEHNKEGKFWGCSNYREKDCRYTEPILS
jgi:DNA helicase-4